MIDDELELMQPEDFGYVSEEDAVNIESMRDYLMGAIESIYVTGDVDQLESMIEELAHQVHLKYEIKELTITKKMENSMENAKHSNEIKDLIVALAKAQSEIQPAKADGHNKHFDSKYTTLTSCMNACKKPLADNDLIIVQYCETINDQLTLVTMLMHTTGQWMKSEFPVIALKQTSQAIGSALTYAKRYGLCGLVGIVVASEDDDGQAATKEAVAPVKSITRISDKQYQELELLLEDNFELRQNFLSFLKTQHKVELLQEMPSDIYDMFYVRAKKEYDAQNVESNKAQEANNG